MEIRFWVWVVSMSCGNIPFPCTFLENKPLLCLLAFSPAGWLRLVSQCCRCLGWPLLWGVCCTVPCWAAQFRGWASCKKHREKHCTGERLHWNPIKERGAAGLKRQAKGEETFYLYATSTNLASTSRGCILTPHCHSSISSFAGLIKKSFCQDILSQLCTLPLVSCVTGAAFRPGVK